MKLSLEKMLQSQGFETRKGCRRLIRHGALSIDGEVVRDPFLEVDTEGLSFDIDGERWSYHAQLYIALNKPAGYECSRSPSHHPSVFELLPAPYQTRGVQPVGRLDQDTTGLLLLSDDGAFIHAQSSPKRHVPKTYLATIADEIAPIAAEALLEGVKLHREPEPLAAASCRALDDDTLELVLEQGKYHQVKRMIAAAGTSCVSLHRSAVGGLELESLGLEPGAHCVLSDEQRARLAQS